MKKLAGISVIAILLLALVLVVSGCTTPTPTATPVVNATATPDVNATATPVANVTVPTNAHTAVINNKTFTFNTIEAGKLKVATDASYAPFEGINTTTNEIRGFDIDLMTEIAKELNLTPEYTNQDFYSIILSIQTGKFDTSISAFTINADRQKSIDFTEQYYENKGQAIAVKPDNTVITNASGLAGKKIAVQQGTVGEQIVRNLSGVNAADIKTYTIMPDVMLALQKGEVDAAVGDYAVMYPYVKKFSGDYKFAPEMMSEVEYFGIINSKDNKELTAAMNEALAKIKADGRYTTIYDRWFVNGTEI